MIAAEENMTERAAALRSRLDGELFLPGDAGYDEARRAWNLTVDQRPAVVVVAENAADVSEAVGFAAETGLGVAVQATGHGTSRSTDGALLIKTQRMNEVRVDTEAQTAWVGAGVEWGPVLAAAQEVGLAPLLGSSPGVGAVGYTLGGGYGWLGRKYGMSCDSVNAFEVVLADGQVVRASATEHEDLFWGLRGSAGSLGVITGMEIRLYPVQMVYGGNLLYPVDEARAVMARYREWVEELPDEMTSSVILLNVPPLPDLPPFLAGKSFVGVRGCYCGPLHEGAKLMDAWRAWQAPEVDMFQEMPFAAVAGISMDPEGPVPGVASGAWIKELSDEAIDVLVQHTAPAGGPPPLVYSEVRHVGGAVSKTDAASNAFSHREQQFVLFSVGMVPVPEAYAGLQQHFSRYRQALAPYASGGVYPNGVEGEEKWSRTADMFAPETLERLRKIKGQYDPENRFAYGLNIEPAA